jgi:uncharacterized protein with HEPN domain
MPKRSNREFIRDMKEAIERIQEYTTGMDYEQFLQDKKTQDAVMRNIEIIGEAVKNLLSDFRKKYAHLDWKKIAGMRDKIIHFYFGVKWDIVWAVIKDKIPVLSEQINNIMDELKNSDKK